MFHPEFTIATRQTSAVTRIEWARSVWLRFEQRQSLDNFTTGRGIFQSAREAT